MWNAVKRYAPWVGGVGLLGAAAYWMLSGAGGGGGGDSQPQGGVMPSQMGDPNAAAMSAMASFGGGGGGGGASFTLPDASPQPDISAFLASMKSVPLFDIQAAAAAAQVAPAGLPPTPTPNVLPAGGTPPPTPGGTPSMANPAGGTPPPSTGGADQAAAATMGATGGLGSSAPLPQAPVVTPAPAATPSPAAAPAPRPAGLVERPADITSTGNVREVQITPTFTPAWLRPDAVTPTSPGLQHQPVQNAPPPRAPSNPYAPGAPGVVTPTAAPRPVQPVHVETSGGGHIQATFTPVSPRPMQPVHIVGNGGGLFTSVTVERGPAMKPVQRRRIL